MYVMMAVGPVCGFLLGALLLGEYVDPFKVPPKMESTSPYWIGLWWGGYLICGILYLLASLPFFLFPRRLSCSEKPDEDKVSEYGRSWRSKKLMFKAFKMCGCENVGEIYPHFSFRNRSSPSSSPPPLFHPETPFSTLGPLSFSHPIGGLFPHYCSKH